jgi:hypothetical protein
MISVSTKNGNENSIEDMRRGDLPRLLVILIPLVVIVPVLPSDFVFRSLVVLFLALLFLVGVYCMRSERRKFLTACILALISIELLCVSLWPAASSLFILGELFLFLFLIYLIRHFISGFMNLHGDLNQILVYCITLILLGGITCGIGLHLSGIINGSEIIDASTLHYSFGQAIVSGTLLIIHGENIQVISPLSRLVLMIGSLYGFLLMIASIGKIVMIYGKCRVTEEENL